MQTTIEPKNMDSKTTATKQTFLKTNYPLLVIAGFWAACIAFIGVSGNFPVNDDWIYAESVQHFLQNGELRLLACAPACVFQILSAAAVCKIFGFSHEVLRSTGVFWAVLGTYALYGCFRQLRAHKSVSLFLTLCFAANPLFISLAFSFMTDTPAIALTLGYAFFLLTGLKKQEEKWFACSALSLIAATLVRQNLGFLALVNAALLACMWLRKRNSWTILVGLVIAPLAVGYLADKWMLATNDFTSLYVWYKGMVGKQISLLIHRPGRMLPTLLQISGELLGYLGLFLLPAIPAFHPSVIRFFKNKSSINPAFPMISAALLMFSMCKFIFGENRLMPFSQNLLRIPELGAHTILGINHANLSNKWRENLTWASGIGGFILSTLMLDAAAKTITSYLRSFKTPASVENIYQRRRLGHALQGIAALLIFGFQFAFNVLQSTFSDIDRYYLFPLLGALLCLSQVWRWQKAKLTLIAGLPLLLMLASYSIAATQDMMAWNRARWTALNKLESQGVNFKQIDGGAEYNYARDPQLFKNLILHETWYEFTHRGEPPRDQWRWWTVAGENYIVSFSPVPNYDVVSKESYWSALSGNREILVLKKSN